MNNDTQSKYFEQHFGKHEEKIKEDYKKKLMSLRDYFHDINSRCNFTKLSKEELYGKVFYSSFTDLLNSTVEKRECAFEEAREM